MVYKGMIFDFNGVLLDDADVHRASWGHIIDKYQGKSIAPDEWVQFEGQSNKQIMAHIFQNQPDLDIEPLRHEKFHKYKEVFAEKRHELRLTDGAIELFEKLKLKNVAFTIATSSWEHSFNLFWNEFDLKQWFDQDKVMYADDSFVSKPEPYIYLKTAAKLQLKPEECVVVEDAKSGIIAAVQAGIGYVIG